MIILSCGCEFTETMDKMDELHRVWTEEVCTRDYDNPFVMAEVSGHYCDKCWKKMNDQSSD